MCHGTHSSVIALSTTFVYMCYTSWSWGQGWGIPDAAWSKSHYSMPFSPLNVKSHIALITKATSLNNDSCSTVQLCHVTANARLCLHVDCLGNSQSCVGAAGDGVLKRYQRIYCMVRIPYTASFQRNIDVYIP